MEILFKVDTSESIQRAQQPILEKCLLQRPRRNNNHVVRIAFRQSSLLLTIGDMVTSGVLKAGTDRPETYR